MNTNSLEIDIVYLWVDGNDPVWQEKKYKTTGKLSDNSEGNNKGRYFSNDELKYSLRSLEKHAPWIRNIFIITDNQKPGWLNTQNPKIKIIDHSEILPPASLPCFNATVIELFIYKIQGLSEYFLFSNDDMFFNADINPGYFFADDGLPIARHKRKPFGKWHHRFKMFFGTLGQYRKMLVDASSFVNNLTGKYYTCVPHHNIDAYLKSDYKKYVEETFKNEVEKTMINHVRTYGDFHRSAFLYYAIATGRAHLKYVGRKQSSRILIERHDFKKYIQHYQPELFCLNDSQRVTDKHREAVKPFLEFLFPNKSEFEK